MDYTANYYFMMGKLAEAMQQLSHQVNRNAFTADLRIVRWQLDRLDLGFEQELLNKVLPISSAIFEKLEKWDPVSQSQDDDELFTKEIEKEVRELVKLIESVLPTECKDSI
jgi:hypothetical protein